MYSVKREGRLALLGFVVVVAVVATSCNTGSGLRNTGADKAGGSGEPVVLRMANTYGDLGDLPAIAYFVDRVEELSGGEVRIEVVNGWGNSAPNAEEQVVRSVSTGEVDLGWAGTRIFDTLGVTSFQALSAPMLVDSYALQAAVIENGITEQMMEELEDLGVVGLSVLADGLRKPIGVSGPILSPADWQGITFGTARSNGQAEAIRALGASPSQVRGEHREEALAKGTIQGFEFNLDNYSRENKLRRLAPYVTANVNLWPLMDVLLANPARQEELTDEQRGWLEEAARDAASRSAALADRDANALIYSCEFGVRFAEASPADLAALEGAFASVYTNLQQDPQTKAYIDQILALKQSTTPEAALTIPTGCTGKAPEQLTVSQGSAPAYLNGIYRYTITKQDVIKHDMGDPADYPTTNTVTLEGGEFSIRGPRGGFSGTYTVEDDKITFEVPEYEARNTWTFSVDDDGDLHLTPVQPMDPGDAFEFSVHPWTRID
jgi:TRAP-type transport system periplasmic protein